MVLNLKKSRITDWWVTTRRDPMNFFNIFSNDHFTGDFVVVGYLDNTKTLATSTNSVIRVTKEGVITAQGSFYPFKEAHPLYLNFLLKANQDNTVIATFWKILDEKSNTMIADITTTESTKERVTFDFVKSNKSNIMFYGYSKQLSANVVICTFRRDGYCTKISIPDVVESDVYNSSIILEDELINLLELIKNLFTKKFSDSYILFNLT